MFFLQEGLTAPLLHHSLGYLFVLLPKSLLNYKRVLVTAHHTLASWQLTEFDWLAFLGISSFPMCSHLFVPVDSEGLFNIVMAHVSQFICHLLSVLHSILTLPFYSQSIFSPPDVESYVACRPSHESWSFIKYITHVKVLSKFPSPVVSNLTSHVPTQNSGPSVKCFYGWKLTLFTLWWTLDQLCDGHVSFQAAFQALKHSFNDSSDSQSWY